MKTIYRTKEWNGYGKQNYYHNEYRTDGDTVEKVRCHRQKSFDGRESSWDRDERVTDSWKTTDSSIPDWLKNLL